MSYRLLKSEELFIAAEELRILEVFNEFVNFAKIYFGESAHTIGVEYDSEYNDAGSYSTVVLNVDVYDKDKNLLLLDGGENEEDSERYEDYCDDKYHLDATSGIEVFIIGQPPVLKYPNVYVEDNAVADNIGNRTANL